MAADPLGGHAVSGLVSLGDIADELIADGRLDGSAPRRDLIGQVAGLARGLGFETRLGWRSRPSVVAECADAILDGSGCTA